MYHKNKTLYFSIEGVPGSGKSHICEQIKEHFANLTNLKVLIVPEPVKEFQSIQWEGRKCDVFILMESDPGKFAAMIQNHITNVLFKSTCQVLKIAHNYDVIIFDRCIKSVRYFTKALADIGYISKIFALFLNSRIKCYEDNMCPEIHGFLLDTKLDICCQRILDRNREGECTYTNIKFLTLLRNAHFTESEVKLTKVESLKEVVQGIMDILER